MLLIPGPLTNRIFLRVSRLAENDDKLPNVLGASLLNV